MNLVSFLDWYSRYNTQIVEVTSFIVLVLFSFIILGWIRSSDSEKPAKTSTLELEETLRKVLETVEVKASGVVAAPTISDEEPGEAAKVAEVDSGSFVPYEEVEQLRKNMGEKELKITELLQNLDQAKKDAETAKSESPAAVDLKPFETKIQELEARLAEYEIIEDDIANLSLYKEENSRLKNEVDQLRKGGGGISAEIATSVEKGLPPLAVAPPEVAVITPEAAAPPAVETAAAPPPTEEAVPDALKAGVDTDKLLAELPPEPEGSEANAVAPEKPEDVAAKLISEFENFVKGG